jgi:hypothetical protein
MLIAACGGSDEGDAESGEAPPDLPAAEQSSPPEPPVEGETPGLVPVPALDVGLLDSGLPDSVALDGLFPVSLTVEGLGTLVAQTAQATTTTQSFAGLRRPDGAAWDPLTLVAETGVVEIQEATYAIEDPLRLAVVTIELSRHDNAEGAERLIDALRNRHLKDGEVRGTIGGAFPDPDAIVTTYDSQADASAVVFASIANLQAAAVVARDGNVVLRVEVVTGGEAAAARIAEALGIADEQLHHVATARDSGGQDPLRLAFTALAIDDLIDVLPTEFVGFERLDVSADGEQVVVQYADATGRLMIVVINAFADAGDLLVTDFAIQQPNGLEGFTGAGTAFDVVEAGPLPAATVPGLLGAAARWQVQVEDLTLFDDVIAFRRASVWVVVQGVSPRAGGTSALDFAFFIDEAIQDLEPQG